MRVLHVFKDYFPPSRGGVEQYIHRVVYRMAGVESTVLTSSRSRRLVVESEGAVKVVRCAEYGRPTSTPLTPGWIARLRSEPADVIHFHLPNPAGELALLASRTRRPVVASYHADIVGRRLVYPAFKPFQQAVLRRANVVLAGSPVLVDTSPALRDHRQKARVVPYGVDPGEWRVRPALADSIRSSADPPVVVYLGRLAYYKGVDVLVRAAGQMAGTVLVVGDGPKRAALETLAAEVGVAGRVRFVGEVDDRDRAAYYHAADVVALPATSRAESFGIAALEAMACGTPVVTTDLGTGTSWLNQHGETGLVVPPGDERALARAIVDLAADERVRREMGLAAAGRVRAHFTEAAMLDALRDVYASLA